MTNFIQIDSNSQVNLQSGDGLYVPQGISLIVSGADAVRAASASNLAVQIDGAVVVLDGYAIAFEDIARSNHTIHVGATGIVRGGVDSNANSAMFLAGGATTLVNSGQISGGTGVEILSGNNSFVSNDGTITGVLGDALNIKNSQFVNVLNAGTITGAVGIVFNNSIGSVINTGSIVVQAFAVTASNNFQHGLTFENQGIVSANMAFVGGAGADFVRNAGTIFGVVSFGSGSDVYEGRGGAINGQVDGGDGDDELFGGYGDDELFGGNDDDLIVGRRGDDTLRGGAGKDILRGGRDDDAFLFTDVTDAGRGANADVIQDFKRGEDLIDLSNFAGIELIGKRGFSGNGPELQTLKKGFGTLLRVDGDGDGAIDFEVKVLGVKVMGLDDFFL